jgi:hypothetical protein
MGVKYMRIKNIYIYTHTHTHTHKNKKWTGSILSLKINIDEL